MEDSAENKKIKFCDRDLECDVALKTGIKIDCVKCGKHQKHFFQAHSTLRINQQLIPSVDVHIDTVIDT